MITQRHFKYSVKLIMAERAGFEPARRFRRLQAFQACLFNHSSIFPYLLNAKIIIFSVIIEVKDAFSLSLVCCDGNMNTDRCTYRSVFVLLILT